MNTRTLTKLALLTALTVVLSLFFIIPIPGTKGFVTLAEVGIFIAAQLFGGMGGLVVGALSGAIIDLLAGYPEWLLFSLLIHGLQGYVVGTLASRAKPILGLIAGSIVMVVGYFFAGWLLFSFPAALPSVPTNIIQNVLGALISTPILLSLKQIQKRKQVL